MSDKTPSTFERMKQRFDSYYSSLSKIGSTTSPYPNIVRRKGSFVGRDEAEIEYTENWAFRRIVEVIPEDSIRQGITIKPDIEGFTSYMRSLKVMSVVEEAHVSARIFGGSLVLVGANDGGGPEEELKLDKIKSIEWLNVFSRWDFTPKKYVTNPFSPNYGKPELYKLNTSALGGATEKQGQLVHASRMVRFDGDYLPPRRFKANSGWHASILQALTDPLKHFGTSVQMGSVLLLDFVTKVLKSPQLVNMLGQEGGEALLDQRIRLAMAQMSNLGVVIVGEDETYEKVQTPITGLVELMDKYDRYLSSASGIPMTRFFGQQLGKLSGATETTREYYDKIKSVQEKKLRDPISELLTLTLSAKNSPANGKIPDGFDFEFNPLIQESAEQLAANRQTQSETDKNYIETGVLFPEEVAISRFGEESNLDITTLDEPIRKSQKKLENNTFNEGDGDGNG